MFGPIHIYGEDYLPVYKQLMKLCRQYFDDVIGTYPDFWDSDESPEAFYRRTQTIRGCDLFIAEVTSPSHGVGMELQMAEDEDIPVIALAQEGKEISTMVEGLPAVKQIIRYSGTEDLTDKLEETIRHY